jgi:hypothetical protein
MDRGFIDRSANFRSPFLLEEVDAFNLSAVMLLVANTILVIYVICMPRLSRRPRSVGCGVGSGPGGGPLAVVEGEPRVPETGVSEDLHM